MVIGHLDSSLRVETLSFDKAADFNPQEWSIWFMTFRQGRESGHQQPVTSSPCDPFLAGGWLTFVHPEAF